MNTHTKRDRFWAGGFLFDSTQTQVLLHKRDAKAAVNPNTWAFFGGLNEGDETPVQCFVRELHEELGLLIEAGDAIPLCDYLNVELNTYRYVFYVRRYVPEAQLTLGEGEGFAWLPVGDLKNYPLTEKTVRDLRYFIDHGMH